MYKLESKNLVEDSFQSFLVEGANFTKNEEYPILKSEMVPTEPPYKIMPFARAIIFQGDLSKTFIYFFSKDKSFERVRRNPKRYLSFFKRTAGIIGPDFSVHSDMPIIKQKSQMNDNLSLSFFFASHGIPLYPAPRGGSDEIVEEYLNAFPKKTLIAVGVHGFIKEKQEKYEWYLWLKTLIDNLNPTGIIVVGHLNDPMFDALKEQTKFYFYDSYMEERDALIHVN